jgi:hypothetical protein
LPSPDREEAPTPVQVEDGIQLQGVPDILVQEENFVRGPGGGAYTGPEGGFYTGPVGGFYTGPGAGLYSGPGGGLYSGPGNYMSSRPGADILKTANSLPILAAGASLGRGCRMVRLVVIALVVVAARADPKPSSPRGFPSWLENGL